jgi:hypothetical protein
MVKGRFGSSITGFGGTTAAVSGPFAGVAGAGVTAGTGSGRVPSAFGDSVLADSVFADSVLADSV